MATIEPKSSNKFTNKVHNAISDTQLMWKDIPLNGKWITSVDPVLMSQSDFQTLTNYEYNDASIKSTSGMTKINTSAPTYLKHRNMFQFNKTNPVENHLLVQSYNSGMNGTVIQDMTQAVPATGDFASTIKTIASVWVADTAYVVGDKVFPTTNNGYYYECVDAGTSDSTEPTWGTTELSSQADNTVRWVCKKGDLLGTFSKAPDGCMAYANGNDVYVWGGDEYRVAKFINYDPADTFEYDYTNRIVNSSVDSGSIATLLPTVGGIDSSTELLLHFEDNLTDSSSNEFTVSAVGGAVYYNSGKFAKAYTLDNAADCLTVPDNAAFDFSSGAWSVDFWFNPASLSTDTLYFQGLNATPTDDYFKIHFTADGAIHLDIYASGASAVSLATGAAAITTGSFQHIEVTENGNNFYIFVNGVLKAYTTSTGRAANYDGLVVVGAQSDYDGPTYSNYANGYLDELRVSSRARHTGEFSVATAVYGIDTKTYAYLCSVIPISGIKWYVTTPNETTCATPTINYWNGSAWTSVGTVVDGTITAGVTMSKTGRMTFTSTDVLSRQKTIDGIVGYWYQIIFDSLDDTTAVYYITTKTEMQTLKDVWDGDERLVASFQYYTTAYTDYTTNILKMDAQTYYDGSDWIYPPETYAYFGASGSSAYFGFIERMSGINFYFPHDQINATAATASVSYWNGSGWSTVGTITDNTLNSAGTASMNHSGSITWDAIDESSEFKTKISNGVELYYYRITFSGVLDVALKLDLASGISAQVSTKGYNSVAMWLNSLWLIGNKSGEKNRIKSTRTNTVCVLNGEGSIELYLGNNEELVGGCTLFSRFVNNIEETLVLFKKDEIWVVDGSNLENIRPYKVSSQYGLSAKQTLTVCDLGVEIAQGVNKAVAMWQSSNGIMMFDNGSLICVSNDIENYFTDMYDTSKTERINPNASEKSVGFYDPLKKHFHWLFAAGTSTTLNRELVYDIARKKWYRIDRTSGKYLQTGTFVKDYTGNTYIYGAIDTGYVERLDYGNTFDGTDITSTFRLADKPLHETMFTESDIRYLRVVGVCTDSAGVVTMYWYGDCATSGTSIGTIDQSQTGYRIYQRVIPLNQRKVFHGIGCVCVSSDSSHANEILAIGLLYKNMRFQINRRES